MKILILGGTLFLARALVEEALGRGHEVTLFNRGRSGRGLFRSVEWLRGDRDGGLDPLHGRSWDAVIDTSGYVPRLVRASAELLADKVDRYVFVSSVSAYADLGRPVDESAPLAEIADQSVEEINGATYGPLKALSERSAEDALPGRTLVIRPGLIVGPYDPTPRFSYWTARMGRGGEVLAPGDRETPVQLIDVRDLAEWMVRMIEARRVGTFNATGPRDALTMGGLLEACRSAAASDASLTWVDETFLVERGVQPWTHLPLWMPESRVSHRYFHRIDISRALAAGLAFRPLEETARDTLSWQLSPEGASLREKFGVQMPDETLAPARERALLDEWHGSTA